MWPAEPVGVRRAGDWSDEKGRDDRLEPPRAGGSAGVSAGWKRTLPRDRREVGALGGPVHPEPSALRLRRSHLEGCVLQAHPRRPAARGENRGHLGGGGACNAPATRGRCVGSWELTAERPSWELTACSREP